MTDTATDNKAKREAIIRKVRALLAKTTENGASEHEALAAASLAADLMKEHDLAYTDMQAEVEAERYGASPKTYAAGGKNEHWVSKFCAKAIAAYWDCQVYGRKEHRNAVEQCVYFGAYDDVVNAHMMTAMLVLAADTEFARYWMTSKPMDVAFATGRASFMHGMTSRIAQRLNQLKAERTAAAPKTTGNALVVIKEKIVAEKLAKHLGRPLKGARTASVTIGSSAAFSAGKAAGDRADLAGRSARLTETRKIGSA